MNKSSKHRLIAQNRKARFNFEIEETFEAGLVLMGTEVKALREGKVNISDSYAGPKSGDLMLLNLYIGDCSGASHFKHEPFRPRKCLLHKREIKKLLGKIATKGLTLTPLSLYFNERGKVKVELGLARGKKLHDKRETEKRRDWDREKSRTLKGHSD